MPSHSCFVPGCKSGYPAKLRKARQDGKDTSSLFRPPKHMVQIWNSIIQRSDRNLHKDDVVCSLHFKEEDIERHYTHVIDGQVVRIERGIPKLRKGAVPSIFSDDNLKGIRAMRRSRALTRRNSELRMPSAVKKRKTTPHDCNVKKSAKSAPVKKRATRTTHNQNSRASTQIEEEYMVSEQNCNLEERHNSVCIEDSNSSLQLIEVSDSSGHNKAELCDLLDEDNNRFLCKREIESSDQLTAGIQKTLSVSEFPISLIEETLKTNDRIPEVISCNTNELRKGHIASLQVLSFTYSELLGYAYMTPLPSSLWAVHKQPHDKYVAFVHMTFSVEAGFKADKAVMFEGTCKPVIFFYGHKVPLPQLDKEVTSVNDVSNLLQDVDEFRAVCLLMESTK